MSRCYPYVPSANRMTGESLTVGSLKVVPMTGESLTVGSLKLDKVKDHAKERKQKKEKKSKNGKRSKNDKDRKEAVMPSSKEHRSLDSEEPLIKKRKFDSDSNLLPGKKYDDEAKFTLEQLEGSGISEEHGQPFQVPQPSESSESTDNSNKIRKLENAGKACRSNGGTIIRFKLPLKKHTDPEPVSSIELPKIKEPEPQTPSTYSHSVLRIKKKEPYQVPSHTLPIPPNERICTLNKAPQTPPLNDEPCFSGRTDQESHSRSMRPKDIDRQLRDLLSSFCPVPLLAPQISDDDNQDWLFGSSRIQRKDSSCGINSSADEGSGQRENVPFSFQPKACHMPYARVRLLSASLCGSLLKIPRSLRKWAYCIAVFYLAILSVNEIL